MNVLSFLLLWWWGGFLSDFSSQFLLLNIFSCLCRLPLTLPSYLMCTSKVVRAWSCPWCQPVSWDIWRPCLVPEIVGLPRIISIFALRLINVLVHELIFHLPSNVTTTHNSYPQALSSWLSYSIRLNFHTLFCIWLMGNSSLWPGLGPLGTDSSWHCGHFVVYKQWRH